MQYFDADNIRAIARGLVALEGVPLSLAEDPLRKHLEETTGLPFAPTRYRVWRNYKRVFGTLLLATDIEDRLICTDACRSLADDADPMLIEEYLWHLVRKWYLDSPVFEGYSSTGDRVFPFSLMIRRLLATAMAGSPVLPLDDVFTFLVGNSVAGTESLERILGLKQTRRKPIGDELRQVREMMRFLSQLPFLFWNNPCLFIDVGSVQAGGLDVLWAAAEPFAQVRKTSPGEEVLALGSLISARGGVVLPAIAPGTDPDEEFLEGNKIRVTHLRVERNRSLIAAFFKSLPSRARCDVCTVEPKSVYPWVDRFLEPHHVLPLASGVRFDGQRTSLKDLVAICPNCHRAVHKYYNIWLKSASQSDFRDAREAAAVYHIAKRSVAA